MFDLLGWSDYLPQQATASNEDIPDHLLFADADAKDRANARPKPDDRYQDALVVQESKRFGLPLDARGGDGSRKSGTPHGQILRYLEYRRQSVGGPHTLGHPDERARVAALRQPRSSPRHRLLRGRPRRHPGGRRRRPAARLPPAVQPRLVHPPVRCRRDLSRNGARGRTPLRGEGGAGPLQRGLRTRLPHAGRGAGGRLRREPRRRPPGGTHLPVPAAVRALRRGPRPATRQRLALRRLRPPQARSRRRGPAHSGR